MFIHNQICLVIGTPRGFTRSVLEALLKRGSRVILACPDPVLSHSEHKRLSALYGPSQLSVNVIKSHDTRQLESVLMRALDTHGDINTVVNSVSDNKLHVNRNELVGRLEDVEIYLNRKQLDSEVQSIKRISKLAVKYLGRHNGFQGGSLLNLVTRTELSAANLIPTQQQLSVSEKEAITKSSSTIPLNSTAVKTAAVPLNRAAVNDVITNQLADSCDGPLSPINSSSGGSCCTVLGTTRALGDAGTVARHGVRTITVYQPNIDYPDLSAAAQITDDEHSPYYTWSRYSAYCREYSGYMALHMADTASAGTAWQFNSELRLVPVNPSDLPNSCKLTNKMCYWLGCPHVARVDQEGGTSGNTAPVGIPNVAEANANSNSNLHQEEASQNEISWIEEDN